MTFIIVSDTVYPTNTTEQIQIARMALTEAEQAEAPVFVGDPNGDHHRNGEKLFAYAPVSVEINPTRQASFAARRQAEAERLAAMTPEEIAAEQASEAERRAQMGAWQ